MEQSQIYDLYAKHSQGIFHYAFLIVGNRQTAEDVLYDTFERMLTKGDYCTLGKEQALEHMLLRRR